ncbi:MAG: S8 family serine peptidase [Burkholderiaceae bacterium]
MKTSIPRWMFVVSLLMGLVGSAAAQSRPRIERAADLPRFVYQVDGPLEEIVRSQERFAPFAAALRRDIESVLNGYDIADKASRRNLINQLALLDFLEGRYETALTHAEEVRALQDKPADKLLSGIRIRTMSEAAKLHALNSEAYRRAVADGLTRELESLPFTTIANDVREMKAGSETIGEALILGRVRDVMQPIATRTGEVSSEFAPGLVGARYALVAALPLKATLVNTFGAYLAAHRVVKSDIWAARDRALAPGRSYAPVRISVWDSGVDTALFGRQVLRDTAGRPVFVAFDKYSQSSRSIMAPLPRDVQKRLPELISRTQGFADLQSNIDSAEATAVKQLLSGLAQADYRKVIEDLRLVGQFEHGTHVAGIALAGNPYARLVVARLEFDPKLQPDPCPSRPVMLRSAAAVKATVAFFKQNKVRVVNMSWGEDVKSIESALEQCGVGASPDERKALARDQFDIFKAALTEAFAGAPEILFITSAGNSNSDPTFVEAVPAGIVLPNLLTVGAVDLAGDEASFTSYGAMVKVHANGYQVVSYLPGGKRVALSGTSMAAPQVANLAAKLLAVSPTLDPPELVRRIVDSADRSADGRRILMNAKQALAGAAR